MHGSFVSNISLPGDASPAKVSGEFKDRVLTVHLVKSAKDTVCSQHGQKCFP